MLPRNTAADDPPALSKSKILPFVLKELYFTYTSNEADPPHVPQLLITAYAPTPSRLRPDGEQVAPFRAVAEVKVGG